MVLGNFCHDHPFSEQEGEEDGHDDPGEIVLCKDNASKHHQHQRGSKTWLLGCFNGEHVPSLASPPVGFPTRARRGFYFALKLSPILLCFVLVVSGGSTGGGRTRLHLRSHDNVRYATKTGNETTGLDLESGLTPIVGLEGTNHVGPAQVQYQRRAKDDYDGDCDLWQCVMIAKTWISNHLDESEEYMGATSSNHMLARPPGHSRRHLQTQDSSTSTSTSTSTTTASNEDATATFSLPNWANILGSIILVAFSALFSGLTLGLMGLDKNGLEIVMAGDDPVAAKNARDIYPLRKNGNLLLCTLLLGNVAVNALLSILMAGFAGGLLGFLLSTALLVVFGEIIPQAVCSRYALIIGSRAVPLVRVIVFLIYPIAFPLSWLLDRILGHELGTIYTKAEMRKLLEIHAERGGFDKDMASAMTGALKYQDVKVSEVMTPWEKAFTLSENERLSYETIVAIFKAGFSRIPVYQGTDRNQVVGLLFVKDLIFIDPEDETPLRSFVRIFSRAPSVVWPDDSLGDVLRDLKQGRSHMALVRDVNNDDPNQDPFYEIKGIITLEDVIEVIIGDEIMDETDALAESGAGAGGGGAGGGGGLGDGTTGGNGATLNGHASTHSTTGSRRHDFDWDRLRFLDTKIVDKKLTPNEERAVTAYLRANYNEELMSLVTDAQLQEMVSSTCVTELHPPGSEEAEQAAAVRNSGGGGKGGLTKWNSRGSLIYASSSFDIMGGGGEEAEVVDEPLDGNEDFVTDDEMEDNARQQTIREPHILYQRGVETDFCALILSGKLTVLAGADEFQSDAGPWSVLGKQALTASTYTPDFTAYATSETCRCLLFTRERFTAAVDASTAERLAAAAVREKKLMEASSSPSGGGGSPPRGSPRGGHNNSSSSSLSPEGGEGKRVVSRPGSYRKSRRTKLMAAFHKTTEKKRSQLVAVAMANKEHQLQMQQQEQQQQQQDQQDQQQAASLNGGSRLSPSQVSSRNIFGGSSRDSDDNNGRVEWSPSSSYDDDAEEFVSLHAKLTAGGTYAPRPRVRIRTPQPHMVKNRAKTPPPTGTNAHNHRGKKNSCASASTTTTSRSSATGGEGEVNGVMVMNSGGQGGAGAGAGGGGDRTSTHGVVDSREGVSEEVEDRMDDVT